jgi:hypothetical protein
MRLLATLVVLCGAVLAGCGGMPKPAIEPVAPRADATHVRVVIVATNYDESWDKEDVPTRNEQVFEQAFSTRGGSTRGTLMMKDTEGSSTSYVNLVFSLISGENAASENVSAETRLEWKVPSSLAEKDVVLVAVISRKTRNNYAIDVLYAMNPESGDLVQVLPSYDAK